MLARLPPAARADRAQLRFSHSAVKPRHRMPPLLPPSPLPLPAAPSPAAAPLDPSALDPATEAAVRALLREGSSANTESAYRAAMRYWAAWFALRFGQPLALPVAAPAVVRFVVDHLQVQGTDGLRHGLPDDIDRRLMAQGVKARPGPLSLNTVLHRIAVLSKAHALQDLVNPCRNEQVATLLARARRAYARRGALPVRKPALTKAPLQALLDTCDDSLEGLRDRALLLFAWASGGRRRSEVVRATTAIRCARRRATCTRWRIPRPTRVAPPAPTTSNPSLAPPRSRWMPGWPRPASPRGRCFAGCGAEA